MGPLGYLRWPQRNSFSLFKASFVGSLFRFVPRRFDLLGFLPDLLFGLDLNGGGFGYSPSDHNKPRMCDHTVFRTYGPIFDVPKSKHVFHDFHAGKSGVRVECIYQRFDLQHRGEITHEDSARPDDFPGMRHDLPRLGKVYQDAVNLPNR